MTVDWFVLAFDLVWGGVFLYAMGSTITGIREEMKTGKTLWQAMKKSSMNGLAYSHSSDWSASSSSWHHSNSTSSYSGTSYSSYFSSSSSSPNYHSDISYLSLPSNTFYPFR